MDKFVGGLAMAKVRMVIELEYDADLMYADDQDGEEWFWSEVLDDGLELHSDHLGDCVGMIKVLEKERVA